MKFAPYIMPVIILALIIYAAFKKVKLYDSFAGGAKDAVPLALRLFPYLCAVFVMTELFELSGLSQQLSHLISPFLKLVGIPPELSKLMLIKPMSGTGSLALLSDIYAANGVDSYISRCATVIYASSDTTFYIAAIYYASASGKKPLAPVIISLISSFVAAVFGAFICLII